MPTKLSLIKDQTTPDNFWNTYEGNPYGDEALSKIKDSIGDLEIPVTSIPSPFAQLHLVETAFSSVNEEYKKTKERQVLNGKTTYHKLISDCLDIFELLYLYDEIKLSGKLRITTWDSSKILALKESYKPGLRTFADVLQLFINNYNKESKFVSNDIQNPFNVFTIILLNNRVIGGTSPLSGFFTTGNQINEPVKNLDGRIFFSEKLPLYKRNKGFQKFLNLCFESQPKIIHAFSNLHEYIELNRELIVDPELRSYINLIKAGENLTDINNYDILYIDGNSIDILPGVQYRYKKIEPEVQLAEIRNSDYVIRSSRWLSNPPLALKKGLKNKHWKYLRTHLSEDIEIPDLVQKRFEERTIPGFDTITYPFIIRNDLLSKYIIELDYNINGDKFWIGENDKQVDNVLLPVKPDYFKFFTLEDLKRDIKIERLDSGAIVVTLTLPIKADNGKGYLKFERTYNRINPENVDDEDKGAIIPAKIYMGIYPFFKVNDNRYNDFYKILLYYHPEIRVNCSLYKDNFNNNSNIVSITDTTVRTRAEEGLDIISKYLEISKDSNELDKDITFDFLGINIGVNNIEAEGLIIPQMGEPINLVDAPSSIAFDIGTSNTYIALSLTGQPEKLLTYRDVDTGEGIHFVMLHKPEKTTEDIKGSDQFDLNSKVGMAFRPLLLNEFMPSLIGDKSQYDFPIRSVINQDNDADANHETNIRVLSNINIPFAFGKEKMRKTFDNAFSNLKWGISDPNNSAARNRLRTFIQQLVIMGRNRILSEGKNPKYTNVLWFKPLSMASAQITTLNNFWVEFYVKYFSKKEGAVEHLSSITESWAPFYSHQKKFGAGRSYLNIDIGGGTSDILLFRDNRPVLTASFRFAGNSLFDEGLHFDDLENKGGNLKDNGFVTKYSDIMEKMFNSAHDSNKMNILEYIKDSSELSSEDLIGFFFTIKEFSERLKIDSDFLLLFLLHNAAIFYHSAQIVKIMGEESSPNYIGLSGNGARLLEISNKSKDLNRPKGMAYLVNGIYKYVFNLEESPKIELQILTNPKESTSIGGIIGLSQIIKNPTADIDNFYIPFGDEHTLIRDDDYKTKKRFKYKNLRQDQSKTLQQVTDNYVKFINFFFEQLWYECDLPKNFGVDKSFNTEKLKKYLTDEININNILRSVVNYKLDVEREQLLNETMFFYPLRAYLYHFSKILSTESQIVKFKGH